MDFQPPDVNLLLIFPFLWLTGWAIALMLLDLALPAARRGWLPWLALAGILPAFVQAAGLWGYDGGTFSVQGGAPALAVDNFSTFINLTLLATAGLSVLISIHYLQKADIERPEYYYLMLFSVGGMMLMGMANDLILIFLALELLSIPLYVLSGFARPRVDSEESAMKYFLLGAFSSGFLVYGIALIYGHTGSTFLPQVLERMGADPGPVGLAGAALILVGLGFKVAAVPFHMWTPDVYEGAPTAVTAFMSVGAKVAGFAAMMRIFIYALPEIGYAWAPALAVISALTMILGNLVALAQGNVKRMLAYSSIAHAGYILMGVAAAAGSPAGLGAALFYLLAYLFTNLGAFAVVIAVERQEGQGVTLDDYRGLGRRAPWLALALAYFMLSLTGVPPTGGFSAKFAIFGAALEADLLWLTIVGVVTSVVSGYFYLRLVYLAFMFDGQGELAPRPTILVAVGVTALATLLLGVYPGPVFDLARQAVFAGGQFVAGG